MYLSLMNVLIFNGLFLGGCLTGALVGRLVALAVPSVNSSVLPLLGGLAAVIGLTWRVHERFRLRPLWLPRCPHCRRVPEYGILFDDWPHVVLECVDCQTRIELWMTRTLKPDDASPWMPCFYLCWPEFVGLWRRAPGTISGSEGRAGRVS